MNLDCDKLFAVGNIVGLRNTDLNRIFVHEIFEEEMQENVNKYSHINWSRYENQDLSCGDFKIEYIIRLDEHGNIVDKLFDRERDMVVYEPMPELKAGTFGEVIWCNKGVFDTPKSEKFVVIGNGNVLYEDGGCDALESLCSVVNSDSWGFVITKVYDDWCCTYKCCTERQVIWDNPEYQEYLNSNTNQ